MWTRVWVGLVLALGITACAKQEPLVTRASGPDILGPYENHGWPAYLTRISLDPGRDYIILAYVPPANPIDLTTPERARGTMAKMVFDQLGAMEAGTTIGHLMIAWQCGGTRGMTSMTGEQDLQGQLMFLNGWGVTPVLSTFMDGALVSVPDFPERQNTALVEGRGVVVASEVSRAQCEAARHEVVDFATDADEPHLAYGLRERPRLNEGGGCLSFALHVAAEAGVMPRLRDLVRRDMELRAVQLGAREEAPEGVRVYSAPDGLHPDKPVFWLSLLLQPWDQGPVVDTVTIPDGEAIMAAMVYAGVGTFAKNDWRYSRILSRDDPLIGAAARYGLRWGYAYPNRRIADPEGVAAVVLER